MMKYPENIWMNMREYLYKIKWKKKKKWIFRITHFWRLADIRDSFDFNIAKLCAASNNCEQKRYFGTMKFRDNVFTGALYVYRFFFISRFPSDFACPFWIVVDIDDLENYLAVVTRDARDRSEEDWFRKRENLRDCKIWFA